MADVDELWEEARKEAYRIFLVTMLDDRDERTIYAHFWDNSSPGGHLNFYTIEPSGRKSIRDSIAGGAWVSVREIETPQSDPAFDRMQAIEHALARDAKHAARHPRPKKDVH